MSGPMAQRNGFVSGVVASAFSGGRFFGSGKRRNHFRPAGTREALPGTNGRSQIASSPAKLYSYEVAAQHFCAERPAFQSRFANEARNPPRNS